MFLGIIGWVAVGVVVGFIASKLINQRGDDPRMGIGVVAAGGLVAGILYTLFTGATVSAWNPWSIVFAAIGAVVTAIIWYAVRSRYVSKGTYTSRRSY